ncbi:MAG: deoxyribodipyrimidine photo-lyase [Chitinophagia bacterium]|nr:deoxyribodipyrimidine photo-lyase [Chitinophagia bacterium]
MSNECPITIFWFRRDLRLHDNAALFHALKENKKVQCIFIFDKNILDDLKDSKDVRVAFIHDTLSEIKQTLNSYGADLWVFHDTALDAWQKILSQNNVDKIYFNRDYEPYALNRDQELNILAESMNIDVCTYKDHVVFESHEVLKDDGNPYVVFTPYKRKWMSLLESGRLENNFDVLKTFKCEDYLSNLNPVDEPMAFISLGAMGFEKTNIAIPSKEVSQSLIMEYGDKRNFPAIHGTSRLGVHYRFGTVSIREKAAKAIGLSETYLNELIWRDFYSQILHHFPHIVKESFRKKYDNIDWRNNKEEFEAWCQGKTGYPIVDAGMRELNTTGYMHNRVRMIAASFLTKHLLIDWRWGEAYFAQKLLDYDLASNNGGWQWASGSGTDAAPYFRIFNPWTQQDKFDKHKAYIKKWIPEYGTPQYPQPIVDHKEARERCLKTYKEALDNN